MEHQEFSQAWDKKALAKWIELERKTNGISFVDLEKKLGLCYGTLDWWRLEMTDQLRPRDIEAIANYRNWTPAEVKEWLKIR